ncbi:unnamed protein product, partial [Hapterophycus canaliculatus]
KHDAPIPETAPLGKFLDGYHNIVSRRRQNSVHVCRIVFQSPAVGDLFYLRLLLHKIPGRSFEEMRQIKDDNNHTTQYSTYHDAARARGIITGDEEYTICLQEASAFQVGQQLRALFVTLILDGAPAPKLWTEFKDELTEDLRMHYTIQESREHALREIDLKLQLHGKTNVQVNLPAVIHLQTEYQRMSSSFDAVQCKSYADNHEQNLTINSEQRTVYDAVLHAVASSEGHALMIDAPAGTGKTYTEKCISSRLRGEGKTVLIVASTGIAALQLPGGWTAHSMFKLPLDEKMTPSCVCNIKSQTQRADLIRKCDLIIWDEVPMTHRYCVEALDRTLQDLLRNHNTFGNKTILFSGDFRQTGPIVKFGASTDTVDASIISSHLWGKIKKYRLTASQRDREDPQYAAFVRSVGEGLQPTVHLPEAGDFMPLNNSSESDPSNHFQLQYTTNFSDLVEFVYPDLSEDSRRWNTRAILATTNNAIDNSNEVVSEQRSGETVSLYSSDSLISDEENPHTAFASPEHLNQLNVSGVPPHELQLKTHSLAMIVRNLNFSEGLVNGQKCILHAVSPNSRVIQVELLTQETPHPIVMTPRINFNAQVGRQGITFSRIQFPLRIAYSMTINKSQGQTLSRIGLDLRSSPFAHGQLYVALSRAQNRHSVMCLLPESHILNNIPHTHNVVYPPFIHAAKGQTTSSANPRCPPPPPPPPPPQLPVWTVVPEIGDGSCGFRALARNILGDPDLHSTMRMQIVHYISAHRDNIDFHITDGIGQEMLYRLGHPPFTYSSVDDYISKMSMASTYMGQPEITAAQQLFGKPVQIHFSSSTLPSASDPNPDAIYLRFDHNSKHFDTFTVSNIDSSST